MNLMEGESGIMRGTGGGGDCSVSILDLLRPVGLLEGDPDGEKVDFFFLEGLTTTTAAAAEDDDDVAFSASNISERFLRLSGLKAPTCQKKCDAMIV